jgi:hypothetical protein
MIAENIMPPASHQASAEVEDSQQQQQQLYLLWHRFIDMAPTTHMPNLDRHGAV